MNYIVMDLEWNQPMNAKKTVTEPVVLRGEIIQIGAVKLNESFQTEDTFKQMVTPKYYTRMHYSVAKLTHIKNADLKQGISFPEALARFATWCGDAFAFLTWGPDDIPILRSNLILHGIDEHWIPACYNVQILFSRQIAKENRQFSLTTAAEMVKEIPETAHDALNDAVTTALICRHLNMEDGLKHYADGKLSYATKVSSEETISKRYSRKADVFTDPDFHFFPDPENGNPIPCKRWVSQKNDRYLSQGKSQTGQVYFVRIRLRKNPDGTYRANRSLHPYDTRLDTLYTAMVNQTHRKRRKKHPVASSDPAFSSEKQPTAST